MSNLHQNIPEDCKKYIKGLSCDFRTCPFIHSAAQREDALTRKKQKKKPLASFKASKVSKEKPSGKKNLPRSSRTPPKSGKGTIVQASNDYIRNTPMRKTQERKSKPIAKPAPLAPVKKYQERKPEPIAKPTPLASMKKFHEKKQKPVVKLTPVAPVKKDDSKDLKKPEKKPGKKVPKKIFTTVLKFNEETRTFVPVDEESEGNGDNGKK